MIIDGKHKIILLDKRKYHCALDITMHFIAGKWKCVVLWYLNKGVMRFSEIKKNIPDITEKTLSIQLKSLEAAGLISRQVYGTKPPLRVEYTLSDFGKTLLPVIDAMAKWGQELGESRGELIDA